MNLLDRFALVIVAVAALFLASVSSPFYKWLLAAALLAALYGRATRQRDLIVAAILTPPLYLLGWITSFAVPLVTLRTIDGTLAAFDHGTGIAVWHWCLAHPACYLVLKPVYYGLGVAIIAGLTFTSRRQELIRALLVGSVAGLFCYFLFPAVGPIWVGQPGAIRNCMPSLHLTWALLLWFYSPKVLRLPWLLFGILTAVAALGLGEHYAIDLVAALPFTAAVCALARFPFARIKQRAISPSESEIGSSFNTPDAGLMNPNAE